VFREHLLKLGNGLSVRRSQSAFFGAAAQLLPPVALDPFSALTLDTAVNEPVGGIMPEVN